MANRLKYTYKLIDDSNNKMQYYTIKGFMAGIDPTQKERKKKSIKDLGYDECIRLNSKSDIEKLSQVDPEFETAFFKRGDYKYYYPKHNGYSRKVTQEDTVYFLEELQEFYPREDKYRKAVESLEKEISKSRQEKGEFDDIFDSLKSLLDYKNKQYGNSALQPMKVFSGKCKVGQRIDDKLARVANSKELRTNDVVDILGYLVLICKEKGWDNFDKFMD